jgi:hypothetical protein
LSLLACLSTPIRIVLSVEHYHPPSISLLFARRIEIFAVEFQFNVDRSSAPCAWISIKHLPRFPHRSAPRQTPPRASAELIKSKGLEKMTVEELVAEVNPRGRGSSFAFLVIFLRSFEFNVQLCTLRV